MNNNAANNNEEAPSSQPLNFPRAEMTPCTRITTRAYDPRTNKVATIQNVLVRTVDDDDYYTSDEEDDSEEDMAPPTGSSRPVYYADAFADFDVSNGMNANAVHQQQQTTTATNKLHPYEPLQMTCGTAIAEEVLRNATVQPQLNADKAYWLQNTIATCIYGRVRKALALRRRIATPEINAEWELTYPREECAVKEMIWTRIRRYRQRRENEDPIKEVAAMQYISLLPETNERHLVLQQKDLLFDDRYLYSVMPFCNHGELFSVLEKNERFSEDDARFWIIQMLGSLKFMQEVAGICHRDVSLENFMVNIDEMGHRCLMIDLGMCLRVPHVVDPATGRHSHLLMPPQGTCGKWFYMSPEIAYNRTAFDGFKADMWAMGVILYMMLMGSPPFETPTPDDRYFAFITAGHLRRMLLNGGYHFSEEVMDLLQKLLTSDFRQRLSLQEALEHPWITMGNAPPPPSPEAPPEWFTMHQSAS